MPSADWLTNEITMVESAESVSDPQMHRAYPWGEPEVGLVPAGRLGISYVPAHCLRVWPRQFTTRWG